MLSVSTAVYISAGTAPFLAVLVVRELREEGVRWILAVSRCIPVGFSGYMLA